MKTPAFLKKGDTIGILSTARKIAKEDLQPALQLLESWGLKAELGKTIGAEENQFAGSDALRSTDFQQMMDDPKIKAIWCARGGYGTVRMVDKLDFTTFKRNPKWIVGYSDLTVFHAHFHNLGIETLHAQMCLEIERKSKETSESIRKVLFGEPYSISYGADTYQAAFGNTLPDRSSGKAFQKLNRLGFANGEIIGGNLSVLYSLCGSPSAINTDGKILFIEDLDEYLYHIDRMMMNLKRNGMLKNLAGLIVGGMTKMNDNAIPFGKTAEEIIYNSVKEYNYPVCFNFPAGHIEDNRALILGREVGLKIDEINLSLDF